MTPGLAAALQKLIDMKVPSVAAILRSHRYDYEAEVMEQVIREAKIALKDNLRPDR